jgi:hypothetical protein
MTSASSSSTPWSAACVGRAGAKSRCAATIETLLLRPAIDSPQLFFSRQRSVLFRWPGTHPTQKALAATVCEVREREEVVMGWFASKRRGLYSARGVGEIKPMWIRKVYRGICHVPDGWCDPFPIRFNDPFWFGEMVVEIDGGREERWWQKLKMVWVV